MAQPSNQLRTTAIAIAASIIALALLAAWDEQQEGQMALADFAEDQAVVARSLALQLETRLGQARKDAQHFAANAGTQRNVTVGLEGYLGALRRSHADPLSEVDPAAAAVVVSVAMADGDVVDLVATTSGVSKTPTARPPWAPSPWASPMRSRRRPASSKGAPNNSCTVPPTTSAAAPLSLPSSNRPRLRAGRCHLGHALADFALPGAISQGSFQYPAVLWKNADAC